MLIDRIKLKFLLPILLSISGVQAQELTLSRHVGGIGIGESAHGVQAFQREQMKWVQTLVQEHGFRQVYLENEVFLGKPAYDYVLNGICDGDGTNEAKAIWTKTVEDRDLMVWLCRWNQVHPRDRVVLNGIDHYEEPAHFQKRFDRLKGALSDQSLIGSRIEAVRTTCPGHSSTSEEWAEIMRLVGENKFEYTEQQFEKCMLELTRLQRWIQVHLGIVVRLLGKQDSHELVLASNSAISRQGQLKRGWLEQDMLANWKYRDRGMYENLREQRRFFGKRQKFVLIMHTSHVTKRPELPRWWTDQTGMKSVGGFIEQEIGGSKYQTLFQTAYQVTGLDGEYLSPVASESFEKQMNDQNVPEGFYSSNQLPVQNARYFFNENNSKRPNGVELDLSQHFDWISYVTATPASARLP